MFLYLLDFVKKKDKKLEKVHEAITNRNNKMETKGILHF